MANAKTRLYTGLNIEPQDTLDLTIKGDIQVKESDGRIHYYDGADSHELADTDSAQTLTNKTIDGDDNILTDISLSSLKSVSGDADTFVVRDANGDVVSGTVAIPDGDVVGTSGTQTLTNKTIDADNNSISNLENDNIKAGAAIDADKIHDGTVGNTEFGYLANVTSDIQGQLDDKLDLSGGTMIGDIAMGSNKVTSSATPTNTNDLTNKAYVDAVAQGLNIKTSVKVATTVAGTLASDFENGDTVDDIVLTTGDRILIKNQVAQEENGIYIVAATGAPARSADADTWDKLISAFVFIQEGTTTEDTGWVCTIDAGGTLGTDPVTFTQFSGAGSVTTDGEGLDITGNELSLELDGTSLSKSASGLKINSNLQITGQTIQTTSGNLDITITPNGTGAITLSKKVNLGAQVNGLVTNDGSLYAPDDTITTPVSLVKRITNNSASTFAGMTAPTAAQFAVLTNSSNSDKTLRHESSAASAANRFLIDTGVDLTLKVDASIWVYYDTNETRWRVIGGAGGTSRTVTSTFASPSIIDDTGITATQGTDEDIYVATASGEVTMNNDPQISAGSIDGQVLKIIGTSNDNYIVLVDGEGLALNGSWNSYTNSILSLRWDEGSSLWREIGRNN